MQIAIVGLARSGKTTVFNSLTKGDAETGGFGGLTVNTGVVKVPDERLTRLTALFKPKKEVPADVTYVDPSILSRGWYLRRQERVLGIELDVFTELAREILMSQALGSYDMAAELVERYGAMRPEMRAVIDDLGSVPVDIDPIYPLEGLR